MQFKDMKRTDWSRVLRKDYIAWDPAKRPSGTDEPEYFAGTDCSFNDSLSFWGRSDCG